MLTCRRYCQALQRPAQGLPFPAGAAASATSDVFVVYADHHSNIIILLVSSAAARVTRACPCLPVYTPGLLLLLSQGPCRLPQSLSTASRMMLALHQALLLACVPASNSSSNNSDAVRLAQNSYRSCCASVQYSPAITQASM